MPADPHSPDQATAPGAPLTAGRMYAALLAGCVGRWAADVLREHGARAADAELVYVHAWIGGGAPGEVWTEAVVEAVRALDAACAGWHRARRALRLSVLLLEEDPALVERLGDALRRAGFGGRLHPGGEPGDLPPGAVALRIVDPQDALGARVGSPVARAFVSLAPPRPERAPFSLVRDLVARGGAEVLLRVPTGGLGGGAPAALPLADLPPYARRATEGFAALLGTRPAEWLAEWRRAADAETALVERLAARLAADLPGAKRISLSAGEGAPRGHWLLLGADPARALGANRLPDDEAWQGVGAWAARRFVRPPEPARAEPLELWGGTPFGRPCARPARLLDDTALAAALAALRGRPDREVFREMVGSDLLPDELRRALRRLRSPPRAPGAAGEGPSLFGPQRS